MFYLSRDIRNQSTERNKIQIFFLLSLAVHMCNLCFNPPLSMAPSAPKFGSAIFLPSFFGWVDFSSYQHWYLLQSPREQLSKVNKYQIYLDLATCHPQVSLHSQFDCHSSLGTPIHHQLFMKKYYYSRRLHSFFTFSGGLILYPKLRLYIEYFLVG